MKLEPRRRKNIRLKGYDYSEPGEYFVTICTKDRAHILGDVVDGVMRLSDAGRIVASCWNEISARFPHTRVDVFQVMPNHVHGIIEIGETNISRRGLINQTPAENEWILMKNPHITLGKIVRAFKARCAKSIHDAGLTTFAWQRNYHDRIICTDVEYYFVERYIRLNPLLWHLDSYNPDVHTIPIDEFKRLLKERHNLDDHAIDYLVDCEMQRRQDWNPDCA